TGERSQIHDPRPNTCHLPIHRTNTQALRYFLDQHVRGIELAMNESSRKLHYALDDLLKTGGKIFDSSLLLSRRSRICELFSAPHPRPVKVLVAIQQIRIAVQIRNIVNKASVHAGEPARRLL